MWNENHVEFFWLWFEKLFSCFFFKKMENRENCNSNMKRKTREKIPQKGKISARLIVSP